MRAPRISIDGELVPLERAHVSVLDRGLLYGDGLFEVLRTWRGVAVDLDAHLARLRAAAAELQLRVPAALPDWVRATLPAAGEGDLRVRVIVTRGPGALRERFAALPGGRAIVIAEPLPPLAASVTLAVVDAPVRPGPGRKALAYLDHLVARELAAAAGADDAVRLDAAGDVAECATANVFAVIGGAVVTPPLSAGALPGIVRARVLAACGRLGIPAAARRLALAELRVADELFVTSALRGVVPVARLDGHPRAAPGPVTARLAADHVDEMTASAAAASSVHLL